MERTQDFVYKRTDGRKPDSSIPLKTLLCGGYKTRKFNYVYPLSRFACLHVAV